MWGAGGDTGMGAQGGCRDSGNTGMGTQGVWGMAQHRLWDRAGQMGHRGTRDREVTLPGMGTGS